MGGKMLAAVYYGPRDVRVEKVDMPEVGPNDVLLKVKCVGICGSDVHSYKAGYYIQPGQIMGHEFIGEVAKVGSDVQGVAIGDRGTGMTVGICGTCYWCSSMMFNLCPDLFLHSTGYGKPGAFAEYVLIENAMLGLNFNTIPSEIDDVTAAGLEPTGVAAYAIDAGGVKQGDKVVVLGGGLIGNAIMQIAKHVTGEKVVLTEVSQKRIEAAKELGADVVVDVRREDALKRVQDVFGVGRYHFNEGGMADVVFESAGAPSAIRESLEMARSAGTIVFVGLPEHDAPINTTKIVHKGLNLTGCVGNNPAKAIEYILSGAVKIKPLVSHIFPLAEAKEAFEMQCDAEKSIKVMIEC